MEKSFAKLDSSLFKKEEIVGPDHQKMIKGGSGTVNTTITYDPISRMRDADCNFDQW